MLMIYRREFFKKTLEILLLKNFWLVCSLMKYAYAGNSVWLKFSYEI